MSTYAFARLKVGQRFWTSSFEWEVLEPMDAEGYIKARRVRDGLVDLVHNMLIVAG